MTEKELDSILVKHFAEVHGRAYLDCLQNKFKHGAGITAEDHVLPGGIFTGASNVAAKHALRSCEEVKKFASKFIKRDSKEVQ